MSGDGDGWRLSLRGRTIGDQSRVEASGKVPQRPQFTFVCVRTEYSRQNMKNSIVKPWSIISSILDMVQLEMGEPGQGGTE